MDPFLGNNTCYIAILGENPNRWGRGNDGSEKIWFRRPTAPMNKLYLQVLAKSSNILKDQESIHHFQPANYYKALLAGCPHVLCTHGFRFAIGLQVN